MTRIALVNRHRAGPAPEDVCLPVTEDRKLVVAEAAVSGWRFVRVKDIDGTDDFVPLATLDGVPVWAGTAPSTVDSPYHRKSWTSVSAGLAEPLAALAGRALQVVTWRRSHRFCGGCAAVLDEVDGEHARRCPACALYVPLQLSPAVLLLLRRPSGEILLIRHTYGPTGIWALVAGFVEAGESLEGAVHRELAEEVGLTVTELRYVASQPWAMSGPGVLLAGFTGVCADPEPIIVLDGAEIAEAGWFGPDALPDPLPPPYSLARWLIDGYPH